MALDIFPESHFIFSVPFPTLRILFHTLSVSSGFGYFRLPLLRSHALYFADGVDGRERLSPRSQVCALALSRPTEHCPHPTVIADHVSGGLPTPHLDLGVQPCRRPGRTLYCRCIFSARCPASQLACLPAE